MVMPLWDHSPFKWPTPPYVMWLLIVVNLVVFFVQASGGCVSSLIEDGSERDLVAALELQNLARLVGRRDVKSQSFDDLSDLRDLIGI